MYRESSSSRNKKLWVNLTNKFFDDVYALQIYGERDYVRGNGQKYAQYLNDLISILKNEVTGYSDLTYNEQELVFGEVTCIVALERLHQEETVTDEDFVELCSNLLQVYKREVWS
ncbi:hypothetical protein [Erysipelothrix aquatica]|uniref:hypothetical protein n=1 Tax=Erysipelothrix aquatica TaxID=2683714 RepID=UPI00135960DD|nr:hypothetical protein [Erysipelothrix aquatica]